MPVNPTTAYQSAETIFTLIRSLLSDASQVGNPFTINTIARAGGTVTITTNLPHGLVVGNTVQVYGVTDSTYNGTFSPIAAVPNATTLQYAQMAADSAFSGGSIAGVGSGAIFTDAVLLPYVNSTYRKVQRALAAAGQETFIEDNVLLVVPPVSAVDPSVQVVIDDASDPQLPPELLTVSQVWERPAGSSCDFTRVVDVTSTGGLPPIGQGLCLYWYEWRQDSLNFLGATQAVQIRIRGTFFLPDLVDGTSNVLIRFAQEAIAYLTAANSSLSRGSPLAEQWAQAGQDALDDLIALAVRRDQHGGLRRRRPYSSRRGFRYA
jgi:hypothetical protein